MAWWQTLIVALSTLIVTKVIDLIVSNFSEKRQFNKLRRERIYNEIESLKNEIGKLYELAANWKSFEEKQSSYLTNFEKDHELIGNFNKYPSIAGAARDTIHWCRIVASCEMEHTRDLIENKKQLAEKFNLFLKTCDEFINSLV
jgi:hypothetical protein